MYTNKNVRKHLRSILCELPSSTLNCSKIMQSKTKQIS